LFYGVFNFWPILTNVWYSFHEWNGIGDSTWVGLDNYVSVFREPQLLSSLWHALYLILFFTAIPVTFGLIAAAMVREIKGSFTGALARVALFLPQIIPGAAAGVAWIWMYSADGTVNQILRAIGLDAITRPWLGDFTWALTSVGFIGTWLLTGFCTLIMMSGIGRIDNSLYEAARIDGSGPLQLFRHVTVPGLRSEIGIAVTVTIIGALASFDVVYLATKGGPGYQTMVPGVAVYELAFTASRVGASAALAIVLALLIISIVLPLQRLFRED
jgi:raffinose/stachyose/melibiose transport system permease protein